MTGMVTIRTGTVRQEIFGYFAGRQQYNVQQVPWGISWLEVSRKVILCQIRSGLEMN